MPFHPARSSIWNLASRATSAVTTAVPIRSSNQRSDSAKPADLSRTTSHVEDAPSGPINLRAPSHTSLTTRRVGFLSAPLSPMMVEWDPSQTSEGSHVMLVLPQPFFAGAGHGRRDSDTSTLVGLGG